MILSQGLVAQGQVPKQSQIRIVKLNERTSLHVIYVDYIARLLGGELKVGSDAGEALWVEKKNIPKIWQELHENTQSLLKIAGIV